MAAINPDCLFCKIVAGTIPAKLLYEDDLSIAFADINPQAPTHLLVIPTQHIASLAHTAAEDATMLAHLLFVSAELARSHGLEDGYRLVVNTGDDAGQSVQHLHIHLLGGRHMVWPPG